MNDLEKISQRVVAFAINELNLAKISVTEKNTLSVVLSLCEIFKKTLNMLNNQNFIIKL